MENMGCDEALNYKMDWCAVMYSLKMHGQISQNGFFLFK